jgi:hypothetical protein
LRITAHLTAERGDLGTRDVGQIRDNEIEGAGDFFKEIAAHRLDRGGGGDAGDVEPGEIEGVLADISEKGGGAGGEGQRDAEAAGAGAYIEKAGRFGPGETFEDDFDEVFGLRPRYEATVVADEFVIAELDG